MNDTESKSWAVLQQGLAHIESCDIFQTEAEARARYENRCKSAPDWGWSIVKIEEVEYCPRSPRGPESSS